MKNTAYALIKALKIITILIFIPFVFMASCKQTSIEDMLNEYNKAYDPEFGKDVEAIALAELLPQTTYEIEYQNELRVEAKRGYFNYSWTLKDSSGRLYNCDTGMYVVYINASLLGMEKGSYTLTVSAKDVSKNKYTDTAIVIIK